MSGLMSLIICDIFFKLLFLIMLPRWMSETAAIRRVFTSPAGLFIVILYSLVTGIIALMKPPAINNIEVEAIIKNDHFR